MANLESDVMRSFVLASEVIKDQIVTDLTAHLGREGINADKAEIAKIIQLVQNSGSNAARNAMRQMQISLQPYVRELARLRQESQTTKTKKK